MYYLKPARVVFVLLLLSLSAATIKAEETTNPMTRGMVEATGLGTVDMSKMRNKIQAKILSKRAAVVDAQRNLLEMIEGVRVTSGTTVKDAQLESDLIANRVKGLLKGAFIVEENLMEEDGEFLAEVKMAVCLNSTLVECKTKPTLSKIVYAALEQPAPEQQFTPAPAAPEPPTVYSGLVVDLTNQEFSPYYDVRIVTDGGKEVYGPGHFDPSMGEDWLYWSKSLDEAQNDKDIIGPSPLVVAATGVTEDARIVVSDDDATAVFQGNLKSSFLNRGKVIFVVR